MKKIILLPIFLLATLFAFSQRYMTDEDCIGHVKKYVKDMAENTKVLGSYSYSFKNLDYIDIVDRHADSSPKVIRFDFTSVYKYNDTKRQFKDDHKSIGVYFEKGYAIGYYDYNDIITYSDFYHDHNDKRTLEEGNTRGKLARKYRIRVLMEHSPSFQNAVAKILSYPASTNPSGCLAVLTKTEKMYRLSFTTDRAYLVYDDGYVLRSASDDRINVGLEEFVGEIKHYKNTCDREIVLKGIYKNSRREYFEENRILKPGETTEYFPFTVGGWDDTSQYNVQFFMDYTFITNLNTELGKRSGVAKSEPIINTNPSPPAPKKFVSKENVEEKRPLESPAVNYENWTPTEIQILDYKLRMRIQEEIKTLKDGIFTKGWEISKNKQILSEYKETKKPRAYWKRYDEVTKLEAERAEMERKLLEKEKDLKNINR